MAGRIVGTPMGNGKVWPKKSGKSDMNINDVELDGFPANYVTIELGRDADADMNGDTVPGPLALVVHMAPNVDSPAHFHKFDQISIVIEGSFIVGRKEYGPGEIRVQDGESVYGPVRSGPNGCKIIGFFSGGPDIRDYHNNEKDAQRSREQAAERYGERLKDIDWKF